MHYFFCKKEIIKNLKLNMTYSFAILGKAYRLRLFDSIIEYPARELDTGVLRAAPLVATGVLLVLVGTTFTHFTTLRVVLLVLIRNHVTSFQALTFCSTASDFFILQYQGNRSLQIQHKAKDTIFFSERKIKLHLTLRQKRNLLLIIEKMIQYYKYDNES